MPRRSKSGHLVFENRGRGTAFAISQECTFINPSGPNKRANRQDFSHREADAKSLLDEVLAAEGRADGEGIGRFEFEREGRIDGNDGGRGEFLA